MFLRKKKERKRKSGFWFFLGIRDFRLEDRNKLVFKFLGGGEWGVGVGMGSLLFNFNFGAEKANLEMNVMGKRRKGRQKEGFFLFF